MRLLVPPRVVLALRRTTIPLSSRGAATSAPTTRRKKTVAAVAASAAAPSSSVVLQRLRDLSRESEGGLDARTEREIGWMTEGEEGASAFENIGEDRLLYIVDHLSCRNDFSTLSRVLDQHRKVMQNEGEKTTLVGMRLVTAVLSAAAHAKSLSSLPSPILEWIETTVHNLPEPPQRQRELMVWLLAIVRGDLPMLQQLQQGRDGVGPVIEREKTLRQAALTYLEEGGEEKFKSLWTASGSSLLGDEESVMTSALVHHGVMRRIEKGKIDPSMLRWYASRLAADQRTPIPSHPHFDIMMKPAMSALGGRIEKWTKAKLTKNENKLRRWRSDYSDAVMNTLKRAMISYLKHSIVVEKRGTLNDLRRLETLIDRLANDDERGEKRTVVVDWLNLFSFERNINLDKFLPAHSLVLVGRESNRGENISHPPAENHRIKTMNVTRKTEKTQEIDDVCCIILAVATRGHLLSNDKTRPHVSGFEKYLKESSSFDVGLSRVLRDYLNDAVVTHEGFGGRGIQPVVDHSRAAQWIDKDEKELAFTVARKKEDSTSPFRHIDYYSLHID